MKLPGPGCAVASVRRIHPFAMVPIKIHDLIYRVKIILLLIPLSSAMAQNTGSVFGPEFEHTLTIYVIPSVRPLDWESPAALFNSYLNGHCSSIFRKERTMLGHLFIKLSTPLLTEPLYAGITSLSRKEMRVNLLKEKMGLAVIGTGMKARMEYNPELLSKIEFYTRKKELAYITYKINEEGASRIINFYLKCIQKFSDKKDVSRFYGGAYWPLYHLEGSGCSAFGLALMELANIRGDETRSWKNVVNIPMDLVGGRFNQQMKIRIRDIKKTKSWHSGSGIVETDYLPFEIYDPSLIYKWIFTQLNQAPELRSPGYQPASDPHIPGLTCDKSSLVVNQFAPIFQCRPDTNLFIRYNYLSTDKLMFK